MRIVYKLCMFPLWSVFRMKFLKWAGRSDSVLSKIVSQPGLWMQRLTTFEPDDSMIEVAIAAVTPVLPENRRKPAGEYCLSKSLRPAHDGRCARCPL